MLCRRNTRGGPGAGMHLEFSTLFEKLLCSVWFAALTPCPVCQTELPVWIVGEGRQKQERQGGGREMSVVLKDMGGLPESQ